MMNKQGSGSLGRIFLNFSSPVGIKDYLKSINVTSLNSSNIDKVGYRITQELYLEHHKNVQVNLNMLIATQLLQDKRGHISLSSIF